LDGWLVNLEDSPLSNIEFTSLSVATLTKKEKEKRKEKRRRENQTVLISDFQRRECEINIKKKEVKRGELR
jgi:hypothetical protein